MKTYGAKLITSIVAFLAVAGGVFAYVGIASNSAARTSATNELASAATTTIQPGVATNQAVPSATAGSASRRASLPAGDDSEYGEGSEGGEDGSAPVRSMPTPAPAPATVPPSSSMMGGNGMMSRYRDGTYSATGSYNSPGGPDSLGVTVTLKNGVITAATVTNGANDQRSFDYQEMFIGGYKQLVIGKSIDNANLDYVSGSSLTPIGWNDALAQIRAKAKA